MKKTTLIKFNFIIVFLMILIVFMSNITSSKYVVNAENNNTESEIVMEVNSNRILHSKNADQKKYMASTTKILTAITIIENCDLNANVTVTKETVGVEGSSIYLEEGEILTVKDLLYGLMLRSGNDCAETLAIYCSKTLKDFATLMNKTAKKIGAKNSNFVNPHGLHDENHYSTAYDLALISCYAMKNSHFREIVGTKSIDIPFTTHNYKRHLINKNKMLKEFDGSTGIKTGYTKKAGRCLVSSCKRNGMELVSVVLNCQPMFERSKEILTNCFNEYKLYKIVNSKNLVGFSRISGTDRFCALQIINDIILPLTQSEKQKIKIEYDVPKEINKINKNDALVGFVNIYCENNLIFREKIYNILGE